MPIPAINPYKLAIDMVDFIPTDALWDAFFEATKITTPPIPIPIDTITSILSAVPL